MLPEKHKTRLIQLLGMMGSSHDGECLNAARLAHRLVTDQKLSWANLLVGNSSTNRDDYKLGFERGYAAGLKAATPRKRANWKEWARTVVSEEAEYLNAWEFTFFESFADGRRAVPSEKQRAIFERVAERLDLVLPE